MTLPNPTLFGEPHEPPRDELGPRQRLVLDKLRETGGLEADEAGALVHASRGKHDVDTRCVWCGKEGRHVLLSLRRRGLVVRRRATGRWEPVGQASARSATVGTAGRAGFDADGFPEGF